MADRHGGSKASSPLEDSLCRRTPNLVAGLEAVEVIERAGGSREFVGHQRNRSGYRVDSGLLVSSS